MQVDLLTLYLLAIGTLLASSGMSLWERFALPQRRRELNIVAGGYATLALGCIAATLRARLPGMSGAALSNPVIVSGYLLVLHGVAAPSARQYRAAPQLSLPAS